MRNQWGLLLPFSLGLAACGFHITGGESTSSSRNALHALRPLADCNEVEAELRRVAIAQANRDIDRAKKSALEQSAYCDSQRDYYEPADASYSAGSNSAAAPPQNAGAASKSDSAPGPTSVSKTNNQVAGVDEADFVKNDNHFIYHVSGSVFRIIEAWPASSTHEVGKASIEGEARKLFVLGDRAVVYSKISPPASKQSAGALAYPSGPSYSSRTEDCTYGYDCVVAGDGSHTKITVFDITNRTAPRVVRELRLSSSLIAARSIGTAVHTVLSSGGVRFDTPKTDTRIPSCDRTVSPETRRARIADAYEAMRASWIQAIQSTDVRAQLPKVQDSAGPDDGVCRGYYRANIEDGADFTSVFSFDVAGANGYSAATVISKPGHVYASSEALYMAVPHQRNEERAWFDDMRSEKHASTVHRFLLGASALPTQYDGSGVVKGTVLNQFAMDEYQDHLRVATTSGRVPSPDVHSTMSVLERRGGGLEVVGKVDRIAPSEDIRAVRFDGSRGYVVTFKKTDPLYAFDLANPTAPRITGELKIPGFSTYMHMMDDKHLLTIGYDANDHGSFAYFDGVLLQIFDVSDPANPRQAFSEKIGTRGSSSEALTNHLAFTFMKDRGLLALPMTICEGGGDGSYGTNMTFSGLLVYDVNTASGFARRGGLPFSGSGSTCSNWWTDASSVVERSIVMDNFIYALSGTTLKVAEVNQLASPLASVNLQ